MIAFSLAIFETRIKDNHIFSVKDDYLAIGEGPGTIENLDTKSWAANCFGPLIRNAWQWGNPVVSLGAPKGPPDSLKHNLIKITLYCNSQMTLVTTIL